MRRSARAARDRPWHQRWGARHGCQPGRRRDAQARLRGDDCARLYAVQIVKATINAAEGADRDAPIEGLAGSRLILHQTIAEAFLPELSGRGSGRDWNLATAMVIKGDALVQVMGDWAKGEFKAANKEAGKDFLCYRFPGTDGSVIYNTDMFAMFDVSADRKAAQLALADATMSSPSNRRSTS